MTRTSVMVSILGAAMALSAQTTETTVYNFTWAPNGVYPISGVVRDAAGNLYGTTKDGGSHGLGALYKLDASGHETVLYSFAGGAAGTGPAGNLAIDSAGNLYGTTQGGGAGKYGVVFKVDPSGHETVLHSFTGDPDGKLPYNGVTLDSAGNLYGTTHEGGTGGGVIFKIDTTGNETVLYTFSTGGTTPSSGVIFDAGGNLYGTTSNGGTASNTGVIYRLDPAGNETVLYRFSDVETTPTGNLAMDSAGNLYGETYGKKGTESNDFGTVYRFSPAGQYTQLHRFKNGNDGAYPSGGVVLDASGNLYGTTQEGGGSGNGGMVFKVNASGHESVVHAFRDKAKGYLPNGVVLDSAGNLYGTTTDGGAHAFGVVFSMDPAGTETVLHSFVVAKSGAYPAAGLALDSAGNIYGTASMGGTDDDGVIFKLDAAGHQSVLHTFPSQATGASSTPVLDSAGNLYGTGAQAGTPILWKLGPTGQFTVLYTFTPGPNAGPYLTDLIMDSGGNLYGTTYGGYTANVVYKVDPAGNYTTLYSFGSGITAYNPGAVVRDAAGNLYGSAVMPNGPSEIYKLDTSGNFSVLYAFNATHSVPQTLTMDSAGNIYGTTFPIASSPSVIFKLDPSGNYTVLYTFKSGDEGPPYSENNLIRDAAGNLYGALCGCNGGAQHSGTVYKLDAAGNFTLLHTFTGPEGSQPNSLTFDSSGNLYGTTQFGGTASAGVIFKLTQ